MLRSDVPAEQAWGAWLAGQTQRKELVPELQSLAIPESPRNNLERFFVTNAALDALVQLKAGPEPAWSMRFFEQWPTETLLLLSGAGARADSQLLELVRTQKGYRWFAAANLLLPRRPAGLAAALLTDMALTAEVVIVSAAGQGFGIGPSLSATVSDGMTSGRPNFPPVTGYYLTSAAWTGATVLANGPVPIYYMRNITPPGGQGPSTWHETGGPSGRDRLKYMAELRRSTGGTLPVEDGETKSIVWQAGLDTAKAAATFREEIAIRYGRFIQGLVQAKVLSDDEAKALRQPTITVTVRDARR